MCLGHLRQGTHSSLGAAQKILGIQTILIAIVVGTKQKHVLQRQTQWYHTLNGKCEGLGAPRLRKGLLQGQVLFSDSDTWLLPSSGAADK